MMCNLSDFLITFKAKLILPLATRHLGEHATVAKDAKDKQLKIKTSNKLRKMVTTFGGNTHLFNFFRCFSYASTLVEIASLGV